MLNLVEELVAETHGLQEENQRLRDENNRLKGEQGKPKIKASKKPDTTRMTDHSSESERRRSKKRRKRAKIVHIPIDREEKLELDRSKLADDAKFKEYIPVVVQDVRITTDNIRTLSILLYSVQVVKVFVSHLEYNQKQ